MLRPTDARTSPALMPRHRSGPTPGGLSSCVLECGELDFPTLHYVEEAERSYATFQRLRQEGVIPVDARFQVSFPPQLGPRSWVFSRKRRTGPSRTPRTGERPRRRWPRSPRSCDTRTWRPVGHSERGTRHPCRRRTAAPLVPGSIARGEVVAPPSGHERTGGDRTRRRCPRLPLLLRHVGRVAEVVRAGHRHLCAVSQRGDRPRRPTRRLRPHARHARRRATLSLLPSRISRSATRAPILESCWMTGSKPSNGAQRATRYLADFGIASYCGWGREDPRAYPASSRTSAPVLSAYLRYSGTRRGEQHRTALHRPRSDPATGRGTAVVWAKARASGGPSQNKSRCRRTPPLC